MLRPQYFQKSMLVFVTVASVLFYIAEPALAQRTNRKNSEPSGSEQARQQQAEQARQRQAEQARQRQAEQARQQQTEQARQQQAERARQRQAEQARQQQAEQARQQKAEQARQRQAEQARQRQAEQARQRQAEQARQRQAEQARQQQAEQARQRQAEQARQQQAEQERQRQTEQARQQQAEQARQQKAEQARQQQQSKRINRKQIDDSLLSRTGNQSGRQNKLPVVKEEPVNNVHNQTSPKTNATVIAPKIRQPTPNRINRKQQITSPDDRDLELRTDNGTSEHINRKLPPPPTNTNTVIVNNSATAVSPGHRHKLAGPSRLIYRDRPYTTDIYRREHTYVDYSSRIRTRTITPGFRLTLRYNRGPLLTFRYFYPYYHRKYLFVSLGGFRPLHYRHIRYYWYGYHPYYWCGYNPIAREVIDSSYNYYTYNYYYDDDPVSYQPTGTLESRYYDNIYQQPAEEPAGITLADVYFEEAVTAFEESNYGLAIEKFAKAMELAPDDMILPFAYSQSLFAAQRYTEAAEILRTVLAKITPDKEDVFYPRGLYPKDEVLLEQLDMLTEKVELYKFDADLQLLLGYQLLGLGQLDKAVTPLKNAGMDLVNAKAAAVLLGILEKMKTTEVQNDDNVTNYPESVITSPETRGVETETNTMPEIKFDDTQDSAIGPNTPEMKAVIDANGTAVRFYLTVPAVSSIATEGKITGSGYSRTRQNATLLAAAFILAAVACVCRYISG